MKILVLSVTLALAGIGCSMAAEPIPGAYLPPLENELISLGFAKSGTPSHGTLWHYTLTTNQVVCVVHVLGSSSNDVQEVRASVQTKEADVLIQWASQFLGFVSMLRYRDAEPANVRPWVELNIRKTADRSVAGVQFRLSNPEADTKLLTIKRKVEQAESTVPAKAAPSASSTVR